MPETEIADTAAASRYMFDIVFRGYDRKQVDEYVSALSERADRMTRALRLAEQRLAGVDQESFPAAAVEPGSTVPGLGSLVESIVARAEEEACGFLAAAEADAAVIRARALDEAAMIRARVEHEMATIRADAQDWTAEILRTHDRLVKGPDPEPRADRRQG